MKLKQEMFRYLIVLTSILFIAVITISCKKSSSTTNNSNTDTTHIPVDTIKVKKAGGVSVCYVEVNNQSMLNVGKYTLTDSGQQVFDIAIIFAANINYDIPNKKAVLFNNSNVSYVLQNKATQIVPLQKKGIKVLLSILGNHQGAGICNFTSNASAKAFAQIITDTINYYGLDGVDFDDEYANYGANSTGPTNDSSFVMLISNLRQLLPTKVISFYFYGPAANYLSYNGAKIGSLVNYSWNAVYGTFSVPSIPGMSNTNISPAAIDLQGTSQSTAVSLAQQTKNNHYGTFMCYNLTSIDQHVYLSATSSVLYGSGVTYTP